MGPQQPLALECQQPYFFQYSKWLHNRIPLWEDHKELPLKQLTLHVAREFSKQAFDPIPAHGSPESFPHHNTDTTPTDISRANHHVKEGGRNPTTVLLGILDVAAAFQE
jgi:hypothetical protein